MKKPSDSDMAEIRDYIGTVEWRFAKTMPLCPHFYNVLSWNPEKRAGFFKLVSVIFNHGYKEEWPPPSVKGNIISCKKRIVTYFDVDDYKYWVMDPTIGETDLINRAMIS
jgi:hypothetical protein